MLMRDNKGIKLNKGKHMKCQHDRLDLNDDCEDCGQYVQCYTSCVDCGWFGIPIREGMASERCEDCHIKVEIEHKMDLMRKYAKAAGISDEQLKKDLAS